MSTDRIVCWLATQRLGMCTRRRWDEVSKTARARRQHLCQVIYPRLLRDGYLLPLAVAADATSIYLDRSIDHVATGAIPSYAAELRRAWTTPPLDSLSGRLWRLQDVTSTGEAARWHGVARFLTTLAAKLHPLGADRVVPADVAHTIVNDPQNWCTPTHEFSTRISDDDRALTEYLQKLGGGELISGLKASLTPLVRLLLAGDVLAHEQAALEVPLLAECLGYKRLPDPVHDGVIGPRAQMILLPERSGRWPQTSSQGFVRRGPPQLALRSHLARPHFAERMALGQVLYHNRHGTRPRPRRALLGWMIDLSQTENAHAAETWLNAQDTVRLAAWNLVLDAVRVAGRVPNIDVHAAVCLYGGTAQQLLWLGPDDIRMLWQDMQNAGADWLLERHPDWLRLFYPPWNITGVKRKHDDTPRDGLTVMLETATATAIDDEEYSGMPDAPWQLAWITRLGSWRSKELPPGGIGALQPFTDQCHWMEVGYRDRDRFAHHDNQPPKKPDGKTVGLTDLRMKFSRDLDRRLRQLC